MTGDARVSFRDAAGRESEAGLALVSAEVLAEGRPWRVFGERGFQLDKRQWIDRHPEFRYLAVETTEVDVRRYDRAAIVRCVQQHAPRRGHHLLAAGRCLDICHPGTSLSQTA